MVLGAKLGFVGEEVARVDDFGEADEFAWWSGGCDFVVVVEGAWSGGTGGRAVAVES